jgi:hypothetical protein
VYKVRSRVGEEFEFPGYSVHREYRRFSDMQGEEVSSSGVYELQEVATRQEFGNERGLVSGE